MNTTFKKIFAGTLIAVITLVGIHKIQSKTVLDTPPSYWATRLSALRQRFSPSAAYQKTRDLVSRATPFSPFQSTHSFIARSARSAQESLQRKLSSILSGKLTKASAIMAIRTILNKLIIHKKPGTEPVEDTLRLIDTILPGPLTLKPSEEIANVEQLHPLKSSEEMATIKPLQPNNSEKSNRKRKITKALSLKQKRRLSGAPYQQKLAKARRKKAKKERRLRQWTAKQSKKN